MDAVISALVAHHEAARHQRAHAVEQAGTGSAPPAGIALSLMQTAIAVAVLQLQ
jgi:hypothetical protein